ncbi:Uncharacterised protein [Helicobacter mustelae]|nr:Uncharacterised protein [Helicobacter mustelae]STP13031.1 Uncharacterised protein [Helicobacter mustelae]
MRFTALEKLLAVLIVAMIATSLILLIVPNSFLFMV